MVGGQTNDNGELYVVRTLVLFGRTGNGKSATGNSIIVRNAFNSKASSSGVTSTCELQQSLLPGRKIVNVIDTPGLFDITAGDDFIRKEIVKCIDMAKEGIHAVLVVFSVKNRFTEEDESAIQSLNSLFGSKIIDYMIVVFTGGDDLDENQTLEDYLSDCPQPLKNVLSLCGNRKVLFDNKTKDVEKKIKQLRQLFTLVETVVKQNGGKPYTDELFNETKERCKEGEILKMVERVQSSYEEQQKQITEIVEKRLSEMISRLEQQLSEEKVVRQCAEERVNEIQTKSSDEIRQLRENLERAHQKTDDVRKIAEGKCTIL